MGPGANFEEESMDYMPYAKSNAATAAAAAGALPPRGASTPKRPITSDYIYRTSTPGNPGNKTEFLVASPGYSDLAPTPRGKARGGKGGRWKGRGKGRRGGRGPAAAAVNTEAGLGYLGDFAEEQEREDGNEEEGYLNALEGGVSGVSAGAGGGGGATGSSPYRTRGNRVVIPTEVDGDYEYAPTPSSLRVGRAARREVEMYAEEQPESAPAATAVTSRASRRDKASRRAAAAATGEGGRGTGGGAYGSRYLNTKLPRPPERRKKREKAIPFTGNLKHWFHRTLGSQMGLGLLGGKLEGEMPSRAEQALRHCLSGRMRRWLMYEFHYSAIDRPYFLKNELQELLQVRALGMEGRGAQTMVPLYSCSSASVYKHLCISSCVSLAVYLHLCMYHSIGLGTSDTSKVSGVWEGYSWGLPWEAFLLYTSTSSVSSASD
jgi:hypothetical protein